MILQNLLRTGATALSTMILLTACRTTQQSSEVNRPELYLARQEIANRIIATPNYGTVHVEGPAEFFPSGKHRVYVRDTSKAGNSPTVVFSPPVATKVSDTGLNDSKITAYDIEGADLVGLGSVELLVIAADAASLPFDDAVAGGWVVRRRFPILPPANSASATADNSIYLSTRIELMTEFEATSLFGDNFAKAFYVGKVNFHNHSEDELILDGSSLQAQVKWLMSKSDAAEVLSLGLPAGAQSHIESPEKASQFSDEHGPIFQYMDWGTELRRPLSFSDILGFFDYQRMQDGRQILVESLAALGTLATGAGMFINHVDYAAGVAYFNGIALPEFGKLVLRDILFHLDKLHQRSLKEVERLGPGESIDRIVFFSRGPVPGIHPTKPVYIAGIDPEGRARAVGAMTFGDETEREAKIQEMMLREVAQRNPEIWAGPRMTEAMTFLQEEANRRAAEREGRSEESAQRDEARRRRLLSATDLAEQLLDNNPSIDESQRAALRLLLEAARNRLDAPQTPDAGDDN